MALSDDIIRTFVLQGAGSVLLFLFFWGVFGNLVVKPLLRLLEEREAKTEGAEREAKAKKEEAKSLSVTLSDKRREARLVGITLRDEALKRIHEQAKAMIDSASQAAEQDRARTSTEILELKRRLSVELQQEVQHVSRILEGKILLPPSSTMH